MRVLDPIEYKWEVWLTFVQSITEVVSVYIWNKHIHRDYCVSGWFQWSTQIINNQHFFFDSRWLYYILLLYWNDLGWCLCDSIVISHNDVYHWYIDRRILYNGVEGGGILGLIFGPENFLTGQQSCWSPKRMFQSHESNNSIIQLIEPMYNPESHVITIYIYTHG